MSEIIQVRKKSQITLPQSVRDDLGIEEGDYLDAEVRQGELVLRVKKLVDKQQAWFWTERWQQGEREAEADIREDRTHRFDSAEDAINYLKQKTSGKKNKKGSA